MSAFARYQANAARLLAQPDDPAALSDQFACLAEKLPRNAAQLALARRASTRAPDTFVTAFNLAAAMMRSGRYRDALAGFERALGLASEDEKALALEHIGMAHHDLGDFVQAIGCYDAALALAPGNKEIARQHAIARLARGELAQGLHEIECRWREPSGKPFEKSGIPPWRGESLAGRHLLYAHEQGFGDTIQFVRFLPMLRAARVSVAMPPALSGLIAENFRADAFVDENGPFDADFVCSPMAAAAVLGIDYERVDGAPYMSAEPMRLSARGGRRIGLVWRGSPSYLQDANRSMPLDALCPLFEKPGFAFYSLQVGEAAREVSQLGLDGFIADLTVMIEDWRDTARAIMAMDAIVSVDTAVAHLAGALGKPVFLLLPFSCCWRWPRGREDTPWYRSMRLFRQSVPGDWNGPVMQVREILE